ncbi:MAG: hypothetical protein ACRERC_21885 [Candidatus Binatia bacterium]
MALARVGSSVVAKKGMRLAVLLVALLITGNASGAWTPDEAAQIDAAIRKAHPEWTRSDTEKLLRDAANTGNLDNSILTDRGIVSLQVLGGRTVLLNGVDILGVNAPRITAGDNSNLIVNSDNSVIADEGASVWHWSTATTTVTVGAVIVALIALVSVWIQTRGRGPRP